MNIANIIETIRQLNPIIEVKYKARVKGGFSGPMYGEKNARIVT